MLKLVEYFPYGRTAGPEIAGIDCWGTPAETVCLGFGCTADTDLSELTISCTNLEGDDGFTLVPVDPYFVKVWKQSGIGVYQAQAKMVPELMLKEPQVDLADGYRLDRSTPARWIKPLPIYEPPVVRVEGDAKTSIRARDCVQCCLLLTLPAQSSSRIYTGAVTIRATDAAGKTTEYPLIIKCNVLNFLLAKAEHDLFLWYRGTSEISDTQNYVTPEAMQWHFEDIKRTGFSSISIQEHNNKSAQSVIDIAKDVAFQGNLVMCPPFPPSPQLLNFGTQMQPVYYVSDEIDRNAGGNKGADDSRIQSAKSLCQKSKNIGVRTMGSYAHEEFIARLTKESDPSCIPDNISISLQENRQFFASNSTMVHRKRDKFYYYHWPAYQEKPNLNRVLCGWYFLKSGAVGIAPYSYQHRPEYPFSAFDDFDEFETGKHSGTEKRAFRDRMTTYPARDGVLSTLQWQGMREGITDLRYLITVELVARRAEKSGNAVDIDVCSKMGDIIGEFFERIDLSNIDLTNETEYEPYVGIEPIEYQRVRDRLASMMHELKERMETSRS